MTQSQIDQVLRQIKEDQAALERADVEIERMKRTVRTAKQVHRDALPKLKKAGLIC